MPQLSAERGWQMVRHKYPGKKLSDFREYLIVKQFTIPASTTTAETPVPLPPNGILFKITASQNINTENGIREAAFSVAWADGEQIVVGSRIVGAALFGMNGEITFPGRPQVVPPGGQLNWVVENLTASQIFIDIAHWVWVPRAASS